MPNPAPSTALSQLPARAVHTHFATRPSLVSVVFNALRSRLLERYPALDLATLRLATPVATGGYTTQLLLNVAINHVLAPKLLDFEPRHDQAFFLTQAPATQLKPPALPGIDMQVIAAIIDELPSTLYIDFQQALADYWSETDGHGKSRWQWLGELLRGQMIAAATRNAPLSEVQRDMLTTVATWPELATRLPRSQPPTYVYFIETTLSRADKRASLLTPDLLLVRDKHAVLCAIDGTFEGFDGIDAFGAAWGARMQRQFQFDSLTWRRSEPYGDVFEQQAALILNQQLENLANTPFEAQDEAALEQELALLTDPALLFSRVTGTSPSVLEKVDAQLPAWLQGADADDRFAYHRHLQDMAQVMKKNQGRSFNEGIENLHRFSRNALRQQMTTDHGDVDPDDVMLDFAVAAGYPGGAGIIEHVRMSLTELAVKNLAGKPKGTLTLSSRSAQALPDWLSNDYLLGSTGLIQRVDIGTTYPNNIRDLLLSDSAEARRREMLFGRELKVHLPMQALEFKIRGQYGLSLTGYRYVTALMGDNPSDRTVDGQEVVLRPLALCRKADATPDPVNNMFIIEARAGHIGPHLLYRPLYADSLYEYPTRQALLDAIATPGALQDSVLTWLTDKARPIYAHGGIKEPHIIRFLNGDDTAPYEKPAPATLAVDEGADEWLQSQLNGQLLNHLFGSTARAMVDLADRESVSNSESRWAILMEGAWLLFNTLVLPLVQGPAMLAGWFMVLVSSLEQDLAGLDSNDPTTRELALIDLLLNTAMVLLHAAAPSRSPQQPLAERTDEATAVHLKTWRRVSGLPQAPEAATTHQGSVALPGEPPATGPTALDFSRSLASPRASKHLLAELLDVHVRWPGSLPAPQASGPLKGLYRIGDQWHASVGGLLFQVAVVPGFGEVYLVHPQHPLRPGFKLISDGQGHWRLDRRARLEGGMPRDRRTAWQKRHAEQVQALTTEMAALGLQFVQGDQAVGPFVAAFNSARSKLVEQKKTLRKVWGLLAKALPELREQFLKRHQLEQQLTAKAKVELDIAYTNYQQAKERFLPTVKQYQDKAAELMTVDRTNPKYKRQSDIATTYLYNHWGSLFDIEMQKFSDTNETQRGESYIELSGRVSDELMEGVTDGYKEILELWKTQAELFKQLTALAEKMETIQQQADPTLRKQLLQDRPDYEAISTTSIKQSQLMFYSELVLDRNHRSREPSEHPYVMELTDPNKDEIILSHGEVSDSSGYSTTEQMEVLKSVLDLYERQENAVNSLVEMGSGFIRQDYHLPFLEHLRVARASLETQLADLILVEEGFATQPPPAKVARTKPQTKIVFKTRDQRNLVGDLQPAASQSGGRLVEIRDPVSQKVVATYNEHVNEGVWVEVVEPTAPTPPARSVVRTLETIEQEAETVKARRAKVERTIRDQQRKLQDPTRREELRPLEWDEMLSPQARQLEALADEINRDHATHANAGALMDAYRDEARNLQQLAYELCSEGFKQQRPKAANIAYLRKHGFVDINLVRSRIALKAGDYLTEYVVRDKLKIKEGKKPEDTVLWYAHFHYPRPDTPPSAPTFGHLKTKEERLFTRKELMEQAQANHRAVVNLEKVAIKPPLDQQLFLGLEPAVQRAPR